MWLWLALVLCVRGGKGRWLSRTRDFLVNLDDYNFYHVMDLPDGRTTPGAADHRNHPGFLTLDQPGLFKEKRVLDIGANDGFWSFWSEQAGAADVLAIDVEKYTDYDWGFDGPPASMCQVPQQNKDIVFFALRDALKSQVRREHASVYDLNPERFGLFDIVFCYGLLYHLRHPLLALERIRGVCCDFVVIETHINNRHRMLPHSLFFWDDVFYGHTN